MPITRRRLRLVGTLALAAATFGFPVAALETLPGPANVRQVP